MNKIGIAQKLFSILVLLTIVISFFCLTSCSNELDIEEIRKTVLIGNRFGIIETIPFDAPLEYKRANDIGNEIEISSLYNQNEIFLHDTKYIIDHIDTKASYNSRIGEPVVHFRGWNTNGDMVYIDFTHDSKEVVFYGVDTTKYDNDSEAIITQDDALAIAYKFIDDTLIPQFDKEIDISHYTLFETVIYNNDTSAPKSYYFTWRWIVNDITFHDFGIIVSASGKIKQVDCNPIFVTSLVDEIPLLTEEQYCEILKDIIQRGYSEQGENVVLDNLSLLYGNKTKPEEILRIVKLYSPDIYAIQIPFTWTATNADGIVNEQACYFYIPIET